MDLATDCAIKMERGDGDILEISALGPVSNAARINITDYHKYGHRRHFEQTAILRYISLACKRKASAIDQILTALSRLQNLLVHSFLNARRIGSSVIAVNYFLTVGWRFKNWTHF